MDEESATAGARFVDEGDDGAEVECECLCRLGVTGLSLGGAGYSERVAAGWQRLRQSVMRVSSTRLRCDKEASGEANQEAGEEVSEEVSE